MANIYLVRHAESIANKQGIYQGLSYDTDLSDEGKRQAEALAKRFRRVELSQIIASPLKRTFETAKVVGQMKKLKVIPEIEIIETNHGDWEGKHKDVVEKTWPHIYRKWRRFPSNTKFPKGEHFLETQKRVLKWWQLFNQSIQGDILVVSHDNIIRVIVARILNRKLNKIWKYHLQPTAVTVVRVTNDGTQLVNLGDSQHLKGFDVDLSVHAL